MCELPPEAAFVSDLGGFSPEKTKKVVSSVVQFPPMPTGCFPVAPLGQITHTHCVTEDSWHHVNVADGREQRAPEGFLHRGLSSAGVTERSGPGVVIHKVANSFPGVADLPAFRKRILILKPSYKHTHTRKHKLGRKKTLFPWEQI